MKLILTPAIGGRPRSHLAQGLAVAAANLCNPPELVSQVISGFPKLAVVIRAGHLFDVAGLYLLYGFRPLLRPGVARPL